MTCKGLLDFNIKVFKSYNTSDISSVDITLRTRVTYASMSLVCVNYDLDDTIASRMKKQQVSKKSCQSC